MMPRKRMPAAMVAPPKKRRKTAPAIEEISFNFAEREDYLSGFHKRKVQRQKIAKEEALKREKQEKITARKILRDERKADLERHVEAVNSILQKNTELDSDADDNQQEDPQVDWGGIEDVAPIDHEDEYVDDDRFTTVTVEAVEVSKDGLHKLNDNGDDDTSETRPIVAAEDSSRNAERSKEVRSKPPWLKDMPGAPKKTKTKKKKFKYESKAERKVTRHKERSGAKKQAMARKA